MGLVNAKCLNCGANLKVDNQSNTGTCKHCGASYITEDVIINNITNIHYSETINGVDLKRQAVLENLLIEYYYDRFNDIDNIKEYALKVQEIDINNALAKFVVFKNIDSSKDIKELLASKNLNISLDLFIILLNSCDEDINIAIINNLKRYELQMDKLLVLKTLIEKYYKINFTFILNTIYNFKLTESENEIILDELYNKARISKIAFLSQLKIFSSKHEDFLYNEQKFDGYAQHWKDLKAKQKAISEGLKQEKIKQTNAITEPAKTKQTNKNKKVLAIIGFGAILLLIILILTFIF